MDHRIATACGAVALLAAASACGSDGQDPATASATTGPQTSQQGAGQFPGANGKVAAVDGSTAQVQSQQNGQVAVSWTSSTTFTREVPASLSDVKVGDCVMATPSQDSTDSSDSASTKVAAASVRITAATGGTCAAGFRGGPGGQGPSLNGTPPSGAPSRAPSAAPSGAPRQLRGSFGAFGTVTAVSGSGFTVSSTQPGSDTATEVSVSTSASTTFTTNAQATASDVTVGSCLNAQGPTDDTGAVTATTIALSTAVDGECGGGFFRSRASNGSGTSTDAGQQS